MWDDFIGFVIAPLVIMAITFSIIFYHLNKPSRKELVMKTPDGPIVPLGEEDKSFPDEVTEILHADEIDDLQNQLDQIREKQRTKDRRTAQRRFNKRKEGR